MEKLKELYALAKEHKKISIAIGVVIFYNYSHKYITQNYYHNGNGSINALGVDT